MNLLINLCLALFVLVSLLMVLVILMQRPKSEGLGAAFGGGVTENIFGAQTTNVLVKFTTWLAGIFFALTFALSIVNAHKSTAGSAFRRELMKNQAAPPTSLRLEEQNLRRFHHRRVRLFKPRRVSRLRQILARVFCPPAARDKPFRQQPPRNHKRAFA